MTRNATQRNATQRNATQRNATQRNATQRNATQRNATQRNATQQYARLNSLRQVPLPPCFLEVLYEYTQQSSTGNRNSFF